jgi:hypothetical protein
MISVAGSNRYQPQWVSAMSSKPTLSQVALAVALTAICFPAFLLGPGLGLSPTGQVMVAVCGIFIGCNQRFLWSNRNKRLSELLGRTWTNRIIGGFALLVLIVVVELAYYSHGRQLMSPMVWLWIGLGAKLYSLGPEPVIAWLDQQRPGAGGPLSTKGALCHSGAPRL